MNWSLVYAIGVWINLPMSIGIAVLNVRTAKIQRDLRDNDQQMFENWSGLQARIVALEMELMGRSWFPSDTPPPA